MPEVVQSSAMDCGPAALKSFLEGHGVAVSYGRLREACQTDVDGTSIETLEELANGLGVAVEQVLLPQDFVLLEEASALPAIAVFRLPNGNTHFSVVWSLTAGLAQVMDPATGRRWLPRAQLLHELYEHVMTVSAADWRAWAVSDEGLFLARRGLSSIGLSSDALEALVSDALSDESFRSLAALDAAARAVRSMQRAGAVGRGREAQSLVATLYKEGRETPDAIPPAYWSVFPAEAEGGGEMVVVRGTVLLRPASAKAAAGPPKLGEPPPESEGGSEKPRGWGPAIEAARGEEPERPLRDLWRLVKKDGARAPAALVAAAFGAATIVVIEALLFRGLLELAPGFGLTEYRLGLVGALLAFMGVALVLSLSAVTGELRIGRRLEARLRLLFQEKIPRLGDRYFHSRLTSDMAERYHNVHLVRKLPLIAGQLARSLFEILLTAAAIVWFEPSTAPAVVLVLVASLAIPIVGRRVLHERDGRVRSHVGALSRFYLDALLGLVPLRVHGAEGALRIEHEGLLVQWAKARLGLQRAAVALEAAQFFVGYGLVVALLLSHLNRGVEPAAMLLLAYWALNLPVLGLEIVHLAWRYPELRNVTLRATEPLRALEEIDAAPRADGTSPSTAAAAGSAREGPPARAPASAKGFGQARRSSKERRRQGERPASAKAPAGPPKPQDSVAGEGGSETRPASAKATGGSAEARLRFVCSEGGSESSRGWGPASTEGGPAALRLDGVSVRAAGHSILQDVSFAVEPGTHVAVVGASGAGKSSLFGLFLGWHFPSTGRVLVDGAPLTGDRLAEVRSQLAWVDPAVQIWNRSLVDNLRYGNGSDSVVSIADVLERADLRAVLESLPDGLQTKLGEGGGLVSGGEGQRVRLARAFLRRNVRLVLLDEPFRGLDRSHRAELLRRARRLWKNVTLLCITHDVSETELFDRVLVVDGGRVVEDASPSELARDEGSRYRHLIDSERSLAELWSDGDWRRWEIQGGRLVERAGDKVTP